MPTLDIVVGMDCLLVASPIFTRLFYTWNEVTIWWNEMTVLKSETSIIHAPILSNSSLGLEFHNTALVMDSHAFSFLTFSASTARVHIVSNTLTDSFEKVRRLPFTTEPLSSFVLFAPSLNSSKACSTILSGGGDCTCEGYVSVLCCWSKTTSGGETDAALWIGRAAL